jgi:hypothetical protein
MQEAAETPDRKKLVKKILPWIAIGVGLLLVALVVKSAVSQVSGGSVAYAPGAGLNYGTDTLSGLPYYDQYQAKYAPAEEARQLAANPGGIGLTFQDAYPQVPRSIIENGRNLFTECREQGVGCTDSNAFNYNPNATCGCINCCVPKTYGCLDPKATTYNPFANSHDERFCKYAVH